MRQPGAVADEAGLIELWPRLLGIREALVFRSAATGDRGQHEEGLDTGKPQVEVACELQRFGGGSESLVEEPRPGGVPRLLVEQVRKEPDGSVGSGVPDVSQRVLVCVTRAVEPLEGTGDAHQAEWVEPGALGCGDRLFEERTALVRAPHVTEDPAAGQGG